MRLLEWIDAARRDSESVADDAVIEALLADGHRLVRALPGGADDDPTAQRLPDGPSLRRLDWPTPSRWSEGAAVRDLCRSLEGRGIDAIWARGHGIWSPAASAARRLEVPLWLELGSAEEALATKPISGREDLAATIPTPAFATLLHPRVRDRLLTVESREPQGTPGRVPLLVPPPIAGPIRASAARQRVEVVPTAKAIVVLAADRARRRESALERALEAIGRLAKDPLARFELFLEDRSGESESLQVAIGRASLGSRATRLPTLASCRGLLGMETLLVSTAPIGRIEPSLVEAIARGSRFVGIAGPALKGWFVDGREGRVLPSGASTDAWEQALRAAFAEPPRASAPAGVQRFLDPSARVEAVRSVLRRLDGPLTGRFASGASSSPGDSPRRPNARD